jgi:hypothetical protein
MNHQKTIQDFTILRRLIHSIRENATGGVLALLALTIHCAVNFSGGYGYFRDEFYYIACTDHLAWGYVDHPPLSIFVLWLNRMLLGDSVFALRLLPALAGATLVYLTGLIVRDLGGGRMAQLVSCLAIIIAPVYLILYDFYSMNAFEPLFWMGAAYVLIKIVNTGHQKLWLLFGILAGFGLQNKHSMLFFGFAVTLGLVLTAQRKQLVSRWFWIGGIIAGFLFLPNLLWQVTHEWATLEFMRNAQQWKNAPLSPLEFMSAQVLFQQPFVLPLWFVGVLALFFHHDLKKYRFLGWAFIVLLLLFVLQRGKPYYLSPMFPLVISGGAIVFERFVVRHRWKWLSRMYVALLLLGGSATLPLSLPVLPVETYIRYAGLLGLQPPKMERHRDTVLPQVFADRFGWKEMVAEVAMVYNSLAPEEKAEAAIYTQNYGEAGAIDFLGGPYHLPTAISGHNSYWQWGLRGYSGEVLIIVGGKAEDHSKVYESVEQVATHRNAYAMPYETDLRIFLCRKLKISSIDVWKKTKHYI